MSIKPRHLVLLSLAVLAACAGRHPDATDSATDPPNGSDGAVAMDLGTPSLGVPSLDSGLDPAVFAAAVTPLAVQFFGSLQPDLADTIQVGRPWGQFDLHKGPRLEFRGTWRVLVAIGGDYATIATVARDGDSYKIVGFGSTQFIPTLVEREQMPSVSAALDRGRAGLLRRVGDGGDALAAYETDTAVDGGRAEIRVQSLGLLVLDGGVLGIEEMSLAEYDTRLPVE
jgi:hypothetical protein